MKDRTPLALGATDLHIKESNREQVKDLMSQLFAKALKLHLKTVYIAGDVFDGRKSQPLGNLLAWNAILLEAYVKGIEIRCIAGNHDKKDYTSEDSYLDIFEGHSAFTLVRYVDDFDYEGMVRIHMIPFFEEKETYAKYFKQINYLDKGKNILITHVGINGVKNNDGSEVSGSLAQKAFEKFDLVLVGHYHDRSVLNDNIHYVGSIAQNNYGESGDKGFFLINDDLSIEYIQSDFKRYETIIVDIDTIEPKELKALMRDNGGSENKVKFKITGSKEKIQALDRTDFEAIGIDIQCNYKDVEINMTVNQAENFEGFEKGEIMKEWVEFSEQEEIDTEEGQELLKQAMV